MRVPRGPSDKGSYPPRLLAFGMGAKDGKARTFFPRNPALAGGAFLFPISLTFPEIFVMTDSEVIDKRRRADVLPLSLPPRGLSRVQAAAYIGVGPSTFDKMVANGEMPAPKRIRGRVIWDLKRLDCAFDALDDGGEKNPWD